VVTPSELIDCQVRYVDIYGYLFYVYGGEAVTAVRFRNSDHATHTHSTYMYLFNSLPLQCHVSNVHCTAVPSPFYTAILHSPLDEFLHMLKTAYWWSVRPAGVDVDFRSKHHP